MEVWGEVGVIFNLAVNGFRDFLGLDFLREKNIREKMSEIVKQIYSKVRCVQLCTSEDMLSHFDETQSNFKDLQTLTWQLVSITDHCQKAISLLLKFHSQTKNTNKSSKKKQSKKGYQILEKFHKLDKFEEQLNEAIKIEWKNEIEIFKGKIENLGKELDSLEMSIGEVRDDKNEFEGEEKEDVVFLVEHSLKKFRHCDFYKGFLGLGADWKKWRMMKFEEFEEKVGLLVGKVREMEGGIGGGGDGE